MVLIIILIAVCIGLVFYGGYRYGSYLSGQENITLRTQLMLQEKFSQSWANAAQHTTQFTADIADIQTSNLATTMQSVIQLLHAYQLQQAGNSNTPQNEKVSELIAKAKSIGKLRD